jgi:hypothetical protein
MASLQEVQSGLWKLVSDAVGPMGVEVGLGWPPENRLQNIANGAAGPAVSIYARRSGRDVTRWLPTVNSTTINPAAITASLSNPVPTSILTITGTPNVGDAVGLEVNSPTDTWILHGVVAVATSGDTGATLATKLANAINDDAVIGPLLVATPTANTVSIAGTAVAKLSTATANVSSQVREIGRRELEFQITIWAQTTDTRDIIGGPIDQLIAEAQINFGYQIADGSQIRLMYRNSFDIEDATLQDVYRRDFFVCLEYPVTVVDALFPVLAINMDGSSLGT